MSDFLKKFLIDLGIGLALAIGLCAALGTQLHILQKEDSGFAFFHLFQKFADLPEPLRGAVEFEYIGNVIRHIFSYLSLP